MRHLTLTVVLAAVTACTGPVDPGAGLRVSTTASDFQIVSSSDWVTVHFVTRNDGSRPVYLARCGDRVVSAVERWNGRAWEQVSGDACLAIYDQSALALNPGDQREDVRAIGEPGRYRLRLGVAEDPSNMPAWTAVSNAFVIR